MRMHFVYGLNLFYIHDPCTLHTALSGLPHHTMSPEQRMFASAFEYLCDVWVCVPRPKRSLLRQKVLRTGIEPVTLRCPGDGRMFPITVSRSSN